MRHMTNEQKHVIENLDIFGFGWFWFSSADECYDGFDDNWHTLAKGQEWAQFKGHFPDATFDVIEDDCSNVRHFSIFAEGVTMNMNLHEYHWNSSDKIFAVGLRRWWQLYRQRQHEAGQLSLLTE